GHPATDPTRLAAIGQSFGSPLAVHYAAVAAAKGVPVPAALLLTTPGCGCEIGGLSAIPATTRVLVVTADRDDQEAAREIWAGLGQIPADRKDFVVVQSDDHGLPPLVADHHFPGTSIWATLDALDWYGSWKWSDALLSCTFAGQ